MSRDGRPETLWAPWRMTFIRGPKTKGCFFCAYARRPSRDRANRVVLRGKTGFVVMNLYPYNSGHLLVAPYAHTPELADLSTEERLELFKLIVSAQDALDRALQPQGFNIGLNLGAAAGAGVPGHLHFHIVPRWNGDTNFMAVVAGTKVIPQSLDELHADLQKALRKADRLK